MTETEALGILEDNDHDFSKVCKILGVPEQFWSNQRIFLLKVEDLFLIYEESSQFLRDLDVFCKFDLLHFFS